MIRKNATQVVCVAEFVALEGKTEALVNALHALMRPTHQEAGCLRYELNQRVDDPRRITFVEKWQDNAIFEKHCAMPYIKHFFDEVRPVLVESFAVNLYSEVLP